MINKKVTLIGSLLLGMVTFSALVASKTLAQNYEASDAEDEFNSSHHAGVSCYAVGQNKSIKALTEKEVEDQINKLDSLYENNMINFETYNSRKKHLESIYEEKELFENNTDSNQKEIKLKYKLEQEYKDRDNKE